VGKPYDFNRNGNTANTILQNAKTTNQNSFQATSVVGNSFPKPLTQQTQSNFNNQNLLAIKKETMPLSKINSSKEFTGKE
jgi:hypothetical protein